MEGTGPCGPMRIILIVLFRVGRQAEILNLVRIGRYMCPRPQYTDLTTMGGTAPCGAMRLFFGSGILNIKFGANRTFHVPKIPVYRFCLYGRYQILWIDIAHFQYQPAYS